MSEDSKPYAYLDGTEFNTPSHSGCPDAIVRVDVHYGHRHTQIMLETPDLRPDQEPKAETIRQELLLLAKAIQELAADRQGIIPAPSDRT